MCHQFTNKQEGATQNYSLNLILIALKTERCLFALQWFLIAKIVFQSKYTYWKRLGYRIILTVGIAGYGSD